MVFVKKIITFLIVLSLTSQQLFSQEIQLPNYDLDSKEIKFAMDFSNIMMRVSEELYETEDEFLDALKRSKTDEKALEPLRKSFRAFKKRLPYLCKSV
ncbi:hypothetical protein OAT67_04860 [Bacteriovoracaceae bacterium]|nr:hypothetical protein [Bacteriovoracaceae bacterium]